MNHLGGARDDAAGPGYSEQHLFPLEDFDTSRPSQEILELRARVARQAVAGWKLSKQAELLRRLQHDDEDHRLH